MMNAATFGWNLEELGKKNLFFLDARPRKTCYKQELSIWTDAYRVNG